MPELPEVEVTRLSFVDRIRGATITAVELGLPLRWPLGCAPDSLVGRRVLDVHRRGKYLIFILDQGQLLAHLGMSGSVRFSSDLAPRGKHDHVDLETNQGTWRLNDPRRFGALVWAESAQAPVMQKLLGTLGAEPLDADFDPAICARALRSRHSAIKQVLLAGDVVVGAGNIYACEALFHAHIHPECPASHLSSVQAVRLFETVRMVLAHAVSIGGTTLRNFSNAEGKIGYFQFNAAVYDRENQPCRDCGTLIRRIIQGQRSTFFCPHCQKRPRNKSRTGKS